MAGSLPVRYIKFEKFHMQICYPTIQSSHETGGKTDSQINSFFPVYIRDGAGSISLQVIEVTRMPLSRFRKVIILDLSFLPKNMDISSSLVFSIFTTIKIKLSGPQINGHIDK